MVLIALGVAAFMFFAGAFSGYSYCKRSQDAGVIEQQGKDAVDVDKHNTETNKVNKNVAKTITIIKKIVDPTGCLDTSSPDDYVNELLNADRATQHSTN